MPLVGGSHIEINVLGVAHNQAIDNVLNYFVEVETIDSDLTELITGFRTVWRASILPLLCDVYRVLYYQARLIEGVVRRDADDAESPLLWRYEQLATLEGHLTLDAGGETDAEFPTYVAVGARKSVGSWTSPNYVQLPLERLGRGSIRFGPVPETTTDDATGNALNVASAGAWEAATAALRQIEVGSDILTMEIVSLVKNNAPRRDGINPTFARAPVNDIVVNPYMTSQVSRKQSVSNLG